MTLQRQTPRAGENKFVRLAELSDLIDRAEAEEWNTLAIVCNDKSAWFVVGEMERLGVPRRNVFLIDQPIGDVGAAYISQLTRLVLLCLWQNQIGDVGATALSGLVNIKYLHLATNKISDAGAGALSRLSNLRVLDLSNNMVGDEGAASLARLNLLESLDLSYNQISDFGAETISGLASITSLNLRDNILRLSGARAVLNSWADAENAECRTFLALGDNPKLDNMLPAELLEQTKAQEIIAAWRSIRHDEARHNPLPPPETVGQQSSRGARIGFTPHGRLKTIDPILAQSARDDALGRELHAELVAALDALFRIADRSNTLTDWRQAAEETRKGLGDCPGHVRISAIQRIERLRSLREADERRRSETDPLVEPAEPGAAAALREAVTAANLYIATDPYLDEHQRRLADPGMRPAFSLDEARTAEVDLDAAGLAEEALLDELRNARITAETGGEAGRRAELWLNETWRNIALEATRQTLAWLRDATRQVRIGAAITVDDAAEFISEAGVKTRIAAMRAAKAAGESASRIWQHAEPELGKRLVQATVASGFILFVGYNLPLVTRLTANADLVATLQRLFGG